MAAEGGRGEEPPSYEPPPPYTISPNAQGPPSYKQLFPSPPFLPLYDVPVHRPRLDQVEPWEPPLPPYGPPSDYQQERVPYG